MKKNSLGILIFLCCISYSFAQTNNNGSISIPDPNTASFTKFIDNPVNTYNGSTDVTIPVYTIENGNIKIPITLRYNTSGIKVSEEAGIVGLGWNLNVGGVITQTINGVFDTEWEYTNLESLEPSLYTPQPQPHWYWEHNYPPQDIYPFEALNSYCPVIHDENWLNSTNLVNFGKGQPDVYYFGFLQYSGKFFIDYRDGSIHIMEKSDKIEFLTYSKNGFEYWKAKTPDGTWFYFEELSHCWTNGTGAVNSISNYLTKIVFPNGKIINYEYEYIGQAVSLTYKSSSYTHDVINNRPFQTSYLHNSVFTNTSYDLKLLSRIYSDDLNEEIHFVYSDREEGNKKLDMIIVNDNNSGITKKFEFEYEYFLSPTEGNVWWGDPGDSDGKRLKLISFGESNLPKYEFFYSDIDLPHKCSYAQDYWGYYNGKLDNTSLLANFWSFFLLSGPPPADYLPYTFISEGSQRACDTNFSKAGTLEKITYPTGGFIEIEYESNSFSNYKYPCISQIQEYNEIIESQEIHGEAHDNCSGGQCDCDNYYFDLQVSSNVIIEYTFNWTDAGWENIDEAYIKLCIRDDYNTPIEVIEIFNPQFTEDKIWQDSFTIELVPGNYGIYPSNPERDPNITTGVIAYVTIIPVEYTFPEGFLDNCYGGGIRVKSIKQVDGNDIALKTVYEYSPGKLMSPLKFYYSNYEHSFEFDDLTGLCGEVNFLYVNKSSSSIIQLSYDAIGGLVGYPEVVVRREGGSQAFKTGYTKYTYYWPLPDISLNMPNVPNVLNGKIKQVSEFDSEENEKHRINYEYEQKELHRYYGFVPHWNKYWGHILKYSLISSSINIKKITECNFDDNGITYGVKTKDFEYNDFNMVTKITENTSLEDKVTTTYNIYVGDIENPTGVFYSMQEDNVISPLYSSTSKVIENTSSEDIYRVVYDYTAGTSFNVPEDNTEFNPYNINEIIEYPTGTNSVISELQYDSKGNLLEIDKSNGNPISYIWAYNKQYPVVVAHNINQQTLNDVVNSIHPAFEGFIVGLGDMTNPTMISYWTTFNSILRNNIELKDAIIETYTYIPCIGVTSVTDSRNITIYYNYDGHGRLINKRDNNYNITEHFEYNYAD